MERRDSSGEISIDGLKDELKAAGIDEDAQSYWSADSPERLHERPAYSCTKYMTIQQIQWMYAWHRKLFSGTNGVVESILDVTVFFVYLVLFLH